ncbi:MAG: ATP-binding cassette domain-containing protein [Microbacteriaceae bacterium]|nr:MAG: ATP-binding cassette domain-containing protein [Microbacteriaceae bacterium]
MTNVISVQSATRTFGRTKAIDRLSFTVAEGSILGLLGRNGAGKTTIMSIIAGQDRPSSGRVEVLGETPFENASVLSQISYVRDNQRYPDDYKLHHVLRIAPDFAPNWNADVAAELATLAFTVSGTADAVGRLAAGRPVLRSHAIGGLRSVTVRGALDDVVRADARATGVQVSAATLPELVAAFGEYDPESGEEPGLPGPTGVGAPAPGNAPAGADASAGLVAADESTATKKGVRS